MSWAQRMFGLAAVALACSCVCANEVEGLSAGHARPAAVGAESELESPRGPATDLGFSRLPPPAPKSWRAQFHEQAQSLEQFESLHRGSSAGPLYLLPVGEYPKDPVWYGDLPSVLVTEEGFVSFVFAPRATDLAEFIAAFFAVPARVLEPLQLEALASEPARMRRNHAQYDAFEILSSLRGQLPADGYSVTALMVRDVYAGERQEYAFGHAIHQQRVAVASFAQLDPQFVGNPRGAGFHQRIRERAHKLVAHEVGHTIGLSHCNEWRCVMNGVAHIDELDETPLHLGPDCLAKLHAWVEFDPARRYATLHGYYSTHGLPTAASWTLARARAAAHGVGDRAEN